MKRIKFISTSLVLNLILVFSFSAGAHCISDHEIQQIKYHANLNQNQIYNLVELAEKGEPAKGWALLGSYGDPYAAIAAKVLSKKKNLRGSYYNKLITNHWIEANGYEKYKKNFLSVAKQHFRQYVGILRSSGNWPDSDQILMSYFKAVRDHGLRDITVFDAAWDAAGMNKYRSWQKLNHIEQERIIYPTRVCFQIDRREAKKIIRSDLLKAPF